MDLKGSGRMELADWIASKDNPLTARVMVNRIWQDISDAELSRPPMISASAASPPATRICLTTWPGNL